MTKLWLEILDLEVGCPLFNPLVKVEGDSREEMS